MAKAARETRPERARSPETSRLTRKEYDKELRRLQQELLVLEEWIRQKGLRVVVLFEGRDTAGKGGIIKRVTGRLNPKNARGGAPPPPQERAGGPWCFQRYVSPPPAGR